MGVAAMNIAAVELFDEMNTVNEKVNATLRFMLVYSLRSHLGKIYG